MSLPFYLFAREVRYDIEAQYIRAYKRRILAARNRERIPATEAVFDAMAHEIHTDIKYGEFDRNRTIIFHTRFHAWAFKKFAHRIESPPVPTLRQVENAVLRMNWSAYIDGTLSTEPNKSISIIIRAC